MSVTDHNCVKANEEAAKDAKEKGISHIPGVEIHPGVNLKGKEFLLDNILNLGIDGIEAFSSYHNPKQAEYDYQAAQEKRFLSLAEVITTGK